jgi:hypothetical protein
VLPVTSDPVSLVEVEPSADAYDVRLRGEPDGYWRRMFESGLSWNGAVGWSTDVIRLGGRDEQTLETVEPRIRKAVDDANTRWRILVDADYSKERKSLGRLAVSTFGWLAACGTTSLGTILLALPESFDASGAVIRLAVLAIAAGTLGSTVSASVSAVERKANGWEFEDGTKFPAEEPAAKFSKRIVYGFFWRPFLGAAMGFVMFFERLREVFKTLLGS